MTFLTTCAQDHFTWKNVLPAGERRVGPLTVISFPVDEDRDGTMLAEAVFDDVSLTTRAM